MATVGKYKIPKPYKDQDIWFRWFTKKQVFYLIVAAVISMGVLYVTYTIHLLLIGLVLVVILVALALVIPRFKMPEDKYLIGGGMELETLSLRIIKKMIRKKKLYIRMNEHRENTL